MKTPELFDLWAPPEVVWSRWAKPVLFAEMSAVPGVDLQTDLLPRMDLQPDMATAVVIDLPGATSVKAGLALFEAGFRPIPLFNGNRGPVAPNFGAAAILDNDPIMAWLYAGTATLNRYELPLNAPPSFMIDSRRRAQVTPTPGRFDNRWIVFPQDFPSANFLRSQGIGRAVLVQTDSTQQPQEDLAHVLRRWQEAGISLLVHGLSNPSGLRPLTVKRPNRFRSLFYGAMALMGLRRNSAGGFGSVIPQPSSGAG